MRLVGGECRKARTAFTVVVVTTVSCRIGFCVFLPFRECREARTAFTIVSIALANNNGFLLCRDSLSLRLRLALFPANEYESLSLSVFSANEYESLSLGSFLSLSLRFIQAASQVTRQFLAESVL